MPERWSLFQSEVADWKTKVFPVEEQTPRREFDRSVEEFVELRDAVDQHDGTRRSEVEIAGEATDVIIRMLGLITIVGCNATELLDTKIKQMKEKYPADTIAGELKAGIPVEISLARHKQAWQNRNRPQI